MQHHRPFRIPDVFADVHAERNVADAINALGFSGGLKIPVFVEHAVIRQKNFVIDAENMAVVQNGGGVVNVVLLIHKADDRRDAARVVENAL